MLVLLIPTTIYDFCDSRVLVIALKLLVWEALFLVILLLRVQGIVIVGVGFLVRIDGGRCLRRLCRPIEDGPVECGDVVEQKVIKLVVLRKI